MLSSETERQDLTLQGDKERDKTGAVTIISDEEYPAYNRPMLTKSIVAGLSADQIAIVDPSWYEENKVFQNVRKESGVCRCK